MYCKNCGTQMNDGATFCPACGTQVTQNQTQQNNYQPESYQYDNYQQYSAPVNNPEADSAASKALTFGILSVVFGGILAIIFGKIAKNRAKDYEYYTGTLSGKAKVGNILGTIGLIYGIVSLAIVAFYLIFYIGIYVLILGAAGASF